MTTTARRTIRLVQAGTLPYPAALTLQRDLVAARSAGRIPDTLLLLEHPPTITLGARANPDHVLLPPDELLRRGVAVVSSDRGGDVTYHGPGQLVGYPILKLSQYGGDLGRYLRGLEETIIRTLADYGVAGERAPGLTGVWVAGGRAKICAIGVRLSASGITSHGFALNVSTDLSGFAQIVPCGIADRAVTSLERLLGYAPSLDAVSTTLLGHFAAVFGVEIRTEDGVQLKRERPADGEPGPAMPVPE